MNKATANLILKDLLLVTEAYRQGINRTPRTIEQLCVDYPDEEEFTEAETVTDVLDMATDELGAKLLGILYRFMDSAGVIGMTQFNQFSRVYDCMTPEQARAYKAQCVDRGIAPTLESLGTHLAIMNGESPAHTLLTDVWAYYEFRTVGTILALQGRPGIQFKERVPA